MRNPRWLVALTLLTLVALGPPIRAEDKEKTGPVLEAVGGLAVSASYFAFTRVDHVVEGFGKGTMDAAKAKTDAAQVSTMMSKNREELKALKRCGLLDDADKKVLGDLVTVFDEVDDYAKEVSDWADHKDPEHGAKVRDQRNKAWASIQHLKK